MIADHAKIALCKWGATYRLRCCDGPCTLAVAKDISLVSQLGVGLTLMTADSELDCYADDSVDSRMTSHDIVGQLHLCLDPYVLLSVRTLADCRSAGVC